MFNKKQNQQKIQVACSHWPPLTVCNSKQTEETGCSLTASGWWPVKQLAAAEGLTLIYSLTHLLIAKVTLELSHIGRRGQFYGWRAMCAILLTKMYTFGNNLFSWVGGGGCVLIERLIKTN